MLDVGTATGFLSYAAGILNQNHLKLEEFDSVGIDLSSKAVKKAKSIHGREL
jgi:ribosomal protein L11 methylase PrmA